MIKKIVLFLILPVLFLVVLASSVYIYLFSDEGEGGESFCQIDVENLIVSEEVESEREAVNEIIANTKYTNLVLAIYDIEKNENDIIEVTEKMNLLLKYGFYDEEENSYELYAQGYKYGVIYFDFLSEHNSLHNMESSKKFYEKNKENLEEDDYYYYKIVISKFSENCGINMKGKPLDEPFVITSHVGGRDLDNFHYGTDFVGEKGGNIYSLTNGKVVYVFNECESFGGYLGNVCGGAFYGGGNQVQIETIINDEKYYFIYCHMEEVSVSIGDEIHEGQQIGYQGNSGNSTGSHLHLEIHKGTNTVANQNGLIDVCDMFDGLCIERGE